MAPPGSTRILQWNARSIVPKKPDLFNLINAHSVSVAAISETWLRPGTHFRVPGFACLRDDRDDGRAGCALLIRRTLPFSVIPLPPLSQEINAVAARIANINYISVYIPDPKLTLIPDLSTLLFSVPPPLIVLGDFNSHHSSWGSYYTDSFSPWLMDLFNDINVCVINDGSPTRRVYPGQNPKSAVDISACSPELSCLLNWNVLSHSFGSDHFPILISKPSSVIPIPAPDPLLKHKIQQADWEKFSLHVKYNLNNSNQNPSSQNYLHFRDTLIEAANLFIPRKKTLFF